MDKYFVTGAVGNVWNGVIQFGSENPYFQKAQKELGQPKFVSLGDLEKELAGSDGDGIKIYISRGAKLTTAEIKKKFPKAAVKVYQPEEAAVNLPILQNNPIFKYLLRPIVVFVMVIFGIYLGFLISGNGIVGLVVGVIVLVGFLRLIKVYDRWEIKQIEKGY